LWRYSALFVVIYGSLGGKPAAKMEAPPRHTPASKKSPFTPCSIYIYGEGRGSKKTNTSSKRPV